MTENYNCIAGTLRGVDNFHKNALLLFNDLVHGVEQELLANNITVKVNFGNYTVFDPYKSEHMRTFLFECCKRFFFIGMLIKTREEHVKHSPVFKQLCSQLSRDPDFPMFIWYGRFDPDDQSKFYTHTNCRGDWLLNSILLRLQSEHATKITK